MLIPLVGNNNTTCIVMALLSCRGTQHRQREELDRAILFSLLRFWHVPLLSIAQGQEVNRIANRMTLHKAALSWALMHSASTSPPLLVGC